MICATQPLLYPKKLIATFPKNQSGLLFYITFEQHILCSNFSMEKNNDRTQVILLTESERVIYIYMLHMFATVNEYICYTYNVNIHMW